jgi:predicted RecB family endonuclease
MNDRTSKKNISITKSKPQQTMGDRIRSIADRIQQETAVQIKTTSRILGAAAQIANNHDRLIEEVVDMVSEDLEKTTRSSLEVYSINSIKQQFKTLARAKSHFQIKASSWDSLVNKLNNRVDRQKQNNLLSQASVSQSSLVDRLNAIESEIKVMHNKIDRILFLLDKPIQ